MKSIHRTLVHGGVVLAAALAALACGSKTPSPKAPTVTSAPLPGPPEAETESRLKADIARLERERDEARDEARRHEIEKLIQDHRNTFVNEVWAALDDIDSAVHALREKKASPKERAKLDKLLEEAQSRREQIERRLRRVQTEPPSGLERVESDIAQSVEDLAALVSGAKR